MKFCMIGCGGHSSDVHGPAQYACAEKIVDLELAACCDRDETRAAAYREKFGFQRHYRDMNEMIAKERPDALGLVVPTHLTADIAEPLLASGIPLLMEKPPGLNRAELNRLIAAASRGQGVHMVAFNRRFMPVMTRMRAILDAVLAPKAALYMEYSLLRFSRTDPDFSTTAIHAFDAALYLARSPYRRAVLSYHELPSHGKGVTCATVDAEFACGTRVHFLIQPVSGMTSETIAIHGVDHSLFADIQRRNYSHWHQGQALVEVQSASDPSIASMGFFEETAAFIEAVKSSRPATPTLADVRQSIELMEAMRNRVERLEW